ncbi:MAG TPA: HAMP domain-containing histidine kinase [Epsilonproteobacteria bacterium]|nr:HAMP domain-containing histidine kinase [Campylobacterota bacterium]
MAKGKEFFLALLVYVVSMTVLLTALYRFLENWQMNEFNFFIVGLLVLFVAIGWGYVLTAIIFAPTKKIEDKLTVVTNEVMHELNIPISTIRANTSLLKKTLTDEKSSTRLQRIEDATLRLERLYLELRYALQKEMHEIEKEEFDIAKVLQERIAFFSEQGRNTFKMEVPSYSVEADKIGFEQMLDNILSNAMKYSNKEDLIKISLNENILCIEDEGIGMSTSELLRIHERYFQGDDTQEGQGIGLALVKSYCESENIAIDIQSEKNVGTKICLTLN